MICRVSVCPPVSLRLPARQVGELREPLQERELDRCRSARSGAWPGAARRAPAGRSCLGVVVLVAVDEHDEVGVLLDATRTRAGRRGSAACRAAARPRGRAARGRGSARRGRARAPSASARSARPPAPGSRRDEPGGHQLQVVDDDQAEVRLAHLQPARLRADLHHRDRARVVDVDRRLREPVARGRQPRPVVGREACRSAGAATRPSPRCTSAAASPPTSTSRA